MLPIASAKISLRKEMTARRRHLFSQKPGAGEIIAQIILSHGLTKTDDIISVYWPINSELDCRPLINALWQIGRRVALPTSSEQSNLLVFRRFASDTALVPGLFGTLQPPDSAIAVEPNILFLPLLAFDASGRRLGYGGGFYDRSLAKLRKNKLVKAYGLAFSEQERERVPTDALDQPLDGILTELGFRKFDYS